MSTLVIKPLLLNPSMNAGGSGVATRRLFYGLRKIGVEAKYLVGERCTAEHGLIGLSSALDLYIIKLCKGFELATQRLSGKIPGENFSSGWVGLKLLRRIRKLDVNVVHLNQLTNGLASIPFLSGHEYPIIWTLHDWWAMTGGCHNPGSCELHKIGCGRCPILKSQRRCDLSRLIYTTKVKSYRKSGMRPVAVSQALQMDLQASPLFAGTHVDLISNGLDLDVFRPIDKMVARKALELPQDGRILLYGSSLSVRNKGFADIKELGRKLAAHRTREDYLLLTFGDEASPNVEEIGIACKSFGLIRNDAFLALLYSASDITLVPSRQESFGLIAAESIACGTPVVAYKAGGVTDIVDHEVNGFLAEPFSIEDFFRGIDWLMREMGSADGELCLRQAARGKAERSFDITAVARRYASLYKQSLLETSRSPKIGGAVRP